jgi:hypothetical protein
VTDLCIVCGYYADHIHHRRAKSDYTHRTEKKPYDPEDPRNIVPVCMRCHETYHNSMGQQVWWSDMKSRRGIQLANARRLIDRHGRAFREMLPWWLRRHIRKVG